MSRLQHRAAARSKHPARPRPSRLRDDQQHVWLRCASHDVSDHRRGARSAYARRSSKLPHAGSSRSATVRFGYHRPRAPHSSRHHSTPRPARVPRVGRRSTPSRQDKVIAAERAWPSVKARCRRCCRSPVLCRSSCMRRRRAGCRAPRQPPATARRSRAGGQPSGCE